MSTPEGAAAPEGRHLAGVKGVLGKKVAGIPVWALVAAVAAVGLFLAMRNRNQQSADASSVDAGAGPYDFSGSGVADPGGVSGLGGNGNGGGGGGFDPTGGGVAAGDSAADIAGAVAQGVAAGLAEGDQGAPSSAGVDFPSGNPVTQQPAGAKHSTSLQSSKGAPAKSRGGQAVVRPPSHSVKAKPKPAAHKPAAHPHTPAKAKASGKRDVKTAAPPAKHPAPRRTPGRAHR